MQEPCIILWHHYAESYIFTFQALEGGTVTNHKALSDACFENVRCGNSILMKLDEDEIGICIEDGDIL